MKQPESGSRSFAALGVEWASRVMTLGFEFALPTCGGYALDRWWGTSPVATLVGAVLGFAALLVHLLRINREGTGR